VRACVRARVCVCVCARALRDTKDARHTCEWTRPHMSCTRPGIQMQCIPLGLMNRDVVGIAMTGVRVRVRVRVRVCVRVRVRICVCVCVCVCYMHHVVHHVRIGLVRSRRSLDALDFSQTLPRYINTCFNEYVKRICIRV